MEIDKEKFKKKYPHIADELQTNCNKIKIESRKNLKPYRKEEQKMRFHGYDPTVIDFIRRCDNFEEAKLIIDYLENKGEISKKYGELIKKQIKEKGIRSFGSKKERNFYFKNSQAE